jgi:DNA modification methylase
MQTEHITVYLGDALAILRELPSESVDCVVTSPPYWGLRDYGVAGQLGLEPTPDLYVQKMVEVFREVRRVLSDRGTLWLNIGDSYSGVGAQTGGTNSKEHGRRADRMFQKSYKQMPVGLKAKDMVGIPWRVAFALQADGWYLRSDIIWAKPNPMPESVTDRPTKSHEYVFLLSKSERYYYDAAAVAEPLTSSPSDLRKMIEGRDRIGGKHLTLEDPMVAANASTHIGQKRSVGNPEAARAALKRSGNKERKINAPSRLNTHMGSSVPWEDSGVGRNARSVWTIATRSYPEAHFATFPEELPRRCIKAGCPEQVCATCGKPRERTTKSEYDAKGRTTNGPRSAARKHLEYGTAGFAQRLEKRVTTTGFTDCGHGAYVPGVVLDPFAGSGTTLAVARDLGRKSIGIELSPEYVRLIEQRCAQTALSLVVGE